jgi:hypothetical protein
VGGVDPRCGDPEFLKPPLKPPRIVFSNNADQVDVAPQPAERACGIDGSSSDLAKVLPRERFFARLRPSRESREDVIYVDFTYNRYIVSHHAT